MIIIRAGFLAYEMGASRAKNALSSGVKNTLTFAFVIPAFYFLGWWVYWGFPTGLTLLEGENGISGAAYANAIAWPSLEKFGIDDAVGAVTVHGTGGIYDMLVLGITAAGYPALGGEDLSVMNWRPTKASSITGR